MCPALKDPFNGHVTVTKQTIGSLADYTCQRGYIIHGETSRICQDDGKWTGQTPFCGPLEGIVLVFIIVINIIQVLSVWCYLILKTVT